MTTNWMQPEDARCYRAAYEEELREHRQGTAWRRTWLALTAYGVLTAVTMATGSGSDAGRAAAV